MVLFYIGGMSKNDKGASNSMRLFHITLWAAKKQAKFIPRIPDYTSVDEEICTARISRAPTIEDCIRGIGNNAIWKDDNRIRVYTLNIDEKDECLTRWKEIYISEKVHDAPLTHEYWYTKAIVPEEYSECRVYDIQTEKNIIVKHADRDSVRWHLYIAGDNGENGNRDC